MRKMLQALINMRVSLINTSFKDIYGYERMFPLGLGYIASVLMRNGHKVSLLQPQLDNVQDEGLKDLIREQNPDPIGITAVTPTFPEAVKIARIIKQSRHKAQVVLGGVHASSCPEEILSQYPEFDFLVIGEGEYTMLELCSRLKREEADFKDIDGLCFRENGVVLKNRPRSHIMDLDNIPMPARELVDLKKYRLPFHIDKGKTSASMITSRGCPAGCVFCSSRVTMGRVFRSIGVENIIKEIEWLNSQYNVGHIQFVDDTFTISGERVKDICTEIINRNIKFEWHCFARVGTLSRDLIALMKEAGCSSILFGVESADQDILKEY